MVQPERVLAWGIQTKQRGEQGAGLEAQGSLEPRPADDGRRDPQLSRPTLPTGGTQGIGAAHPASS